MNLRQRMIPARAIHDPLRRKLRLHLYLFWRDLWHVCDDFGRFEANAALIRAVLFSTVLDRVSERDVKGYLQELHVAGGVKLYTVRETGYGKVLGFEQPGLKSLKADYPDDAANPPDLFNPADAPDPPYRERKKKEVSEAWADLGPPPHRSAAHTHTTVRKTSHLTSLDPRALAAHLEHLATQYPGVNIRAEVDRATAYVRRQRGPAAKLTLKFFEENWLPHAGGPSLCDSAPVDRIPDEPDSWREMVSDEFPGSDYARGGAKEGTAWGDLDADVRRHFIATMAGWLKRSGRTAA